MISRGGRCLKRARTVALRYDNSHFSIKSDKLANLLYMCRKFRFDNSDVRVIVLNVVIRFSFLNYLYCLEAGKYLDFLLIYRSEVATIEKRNKSHNSKIKRLLLNEQR